MQVRDVIEAEEIHGKVIRHEEGEGHVTQVQEFSVKGWRELKHVFQGTAGGGGGGRTWG